MKKIISLVLALALVLASCVVAFAADDPAYKITVTNGNENISIVGKEFKAYKVFDAKYGKIGTGASAVDTVAYTIKTTNPFYVNTNARAEILKYFDLTPSADDATTMVVTLKKVNDVEITFDEKTARILADKLTPYATGTPAGSKTATTESVEIPLSEAGYYIVTGSVKSPTDESQVVTTAVSMLPVKDATAATYPKADIPPLFKKITSVTEGQTDLSSTNILDAAGKAAVAKVGTVVGHELESIVPDITGFDNYGFIFHDTMTEGLTYNGDVAVYIEGVTDPLDDNDIVITNRADGFDLQVKFTTLQRLQDKIGKKVYVRYSVTVNDKALKYDLEKNTARLEYSNNPSGTPYNHTPDVETYVIDINVDINKYTGSLNDNPTHLAGAKFVIYRMNGTTKEYYKLATVNNKKVVTWVTDVASADEFITDESGNLTTQVAGLDKGTYYIHETKAPDGFNPLTEDIDFTISVEETTENGKKVVKYSSSKGTLTAGTVELGGQHEAQPVDTIDVLNNHGTELPSTGGIGTTIFYILGGLLVVGAAVILVARRKAQD